MHHTVLLAKSAGCLEVNKEEGGGGELRRKQLNGINAIKRKIKVKNTATNHNFYLKQHYFSFFFFEFLVRFELILIKSTRL